MKSNAVVSKFILGSFLLVLFACQNERKEASYETSADSASSTAAMNSVEAESTLQEMEKKTEETLNTSKLANDNSQSSSRLPTDRKFIQTADLRYKVTNVNKSIAKIEQIVRKFGGFVVSSQLSTSIQRVTEKEISTDSIVEIKEVNINNSMVLRIPATHFDTLVTELTNLALFLDQRSIQAQDVTLTYKQNKLRIQLQLQHAARLKDITKAGKGKVADKLDVVDRIAEAENTSLEYMNSNMGIDDQVELSTVNVNIYESRNVYSEKQFNINSAFAPKVGEEITGALSFGWNLSYQIFLIMIRIWPLFLLVIGWYFLWYKKRKSD